MAETPRILVFGIGNPGRQDDGLGPALVETLESRGAFPEVRFEANYQLNIEDALLLSEHDLVFFVDASRNDIPGVRMLPVEPAEEITFTTHAIGPASVLALCQDLYNQLPRAYTLEIKGYSWEINESLTEQAQANLGKAVEVMEKVLKHPSEEIFHTDIL